MEEDTYLIHFPKEDKYWVFKEGLTGRRIRRRLTKVTQPKVTLKEALKILKQHNITSYKYRKFMHTAVKTVIIRVPIAKFALRGAL